MPVVLGFLLAVCCPLCQGLAALAGERWPPSAEAGRGSVAWRGGFPRKVKGGGSRRPSDTAAWLPQPALPSLSSSSLGRLHQSLPAHTLPPHPHSARQPRTYCDTLRRGGSRLLVISYRGTRRPCASVARDGSMGKGRPCLRAARPLSHRSGVSLSSARPMVSLLAAAAAASLATRGGGSDRGWLQLSVGKGCGRGCGARVCPAHCRWHRSGGCAQPGHLAPTPCWDPAASPEPGGGGGAWRPWVDVAGLGGGRRQRREGCSLGGCIWGYARAQPGRWSEESCIVGRAQHEDGRGVAGHLAAGRAAVSGWSYWTWMERCVGSRTAPRRPGWAGRGPKWLGQRRPGTLGKPLSLTRSGRLLPSSGSSTPRPPGPAGIWAVELCFRDWVGRDPTDLLSSELSAHLPGRKAASCGPAWTLR